ncbi:L-seryl-tRNA(Sec) selenium transferase [Helicobacter marmotae]|uniref:L-seryl-tRNA(Sec) selenium transferase n=1 Tax=Helicobacter marmotae TaxID=152490 RepID=UPI0018F81C6E|nr:L-seryl-tRNA(Sec) selenium transferase [Helicobacter marmotae]
MHTLQELLKSIPKVDTLLASAELRVFEKSLLLPLITSHLDSLRWGLKNATLSPKAFSQAINELIPTLQAKAKLAQMPTLERVINATGVVLHTNLGRSVFSKEIIDEITPFLCSYHTLEYDLEAGKRGERYRHCVQLLCQICGCEDALLVNNNAAAVFLILHTFAKHKEVIISRGELVEIGGGFRIPEIMENASCILHEVGTTNKTYLQDYEKAINEQSALIMKAHRSNFYQSGFTHSCHIKELIALAQERGLIDYFDLGSGHMGAIPLKDEMSVQEICAYKPALLSFSGDKLLGGPQAGIICGKRELIATLKKNPLLRTFRVDKFSILSLKATLQAYKDKAYHKIPTLSMLLASPKDLEHQASMLKNRLSCISNKADIDIIELHSLAGGGAMPEDSFKSFGIEINPKSMLAKDLEDSLRTKGVVACIKAKSVLFDMRTLLKGQGEMLANILIEIFKHAR